jgi:hypothetical protein
MAEDSEQKTGGRGQKAEDRGQKADGKRKAKVICYPLLVGEE